MRRRKADAEAEVPDGLRCRRSDGRGWRCPARARDDNSFCEKHFQQRLSYQARQGPRATLNGAKKRQLKSPRVEEIASPGRNKRNAPAKIVVVREKPESAATGKKKISEGKDCSLKKQETQRKKPESGTGKKKISEEKPESATRKRKFSEIKDCSSRKQKPQRTQPESATERKISEEKPESLTAKRKFSEEKDCNSRKQQEMQRTQPESVTGKLKISEESVTGKRKTSEGKSESATGKRKISEEKDCSSRSTTTEKETNLSPALDVEDVASQSTRQTMEKYQGQEIGRCLRKYLASGVMEIALDYDSDYDFRKVAGLELSQ